MPACLEREPELYRVEDARVRCILYNGSANRAS